jgi:hypothetical protein
VCGFINKEGQIYRIAFRIGDEVREKMRIHRLEKQKR